MPIAADPRTHGIERNRGARERTPVTNGPAALTLTRQLLLALLTPLAMLAVAACAIYWIHATGPAAVEAPDRHGLAMTGFLARGAEQGISSGEVAKLEALLQALRAQPGVLAAAIYDRSGEVLAIGGERTSLARELIVGTEAARIVAERAGRLVVLAPVISERAHVAGGLAGAATVGWVQLEFDTAAVVTKTDDVAHWVLLFALAGLALAATHAVRLARSTGEPVERLADAAARMAAGEAGVRVPVDGSSRELRALQDGINTMARSIADAHRRMQATIDDATDRLAYQATHDPMTGLPNRRMFEQVLEEAVVASRRAADHGTLCYIDLDHFKHVNDSCGHAAGDALLCEVASLIGRRMRAQDLICRIGGDEFALILRGCSPEDARHIAEDLCAAVGALRFSWEGSVFRIGASVGLARIDDPLNTPSEVLKAADTACYAAKRTGRSQVMEYCTKLSI